MAVNEEKKILEAADALRLLSEGVTLEDEDGHDILLKKDQVIMRWTFGKFNTVTEDPFTGPYSGLIINNSPIVVAPEPEEEEE
ncbi:MAG: hypothetical protein LBU82_04925 [Treponema sp.]|jgi:hypothetical protein|nr:hypothetical protein [Treponema sp.]